MQIDLLDFISDHSDKFSAYSRAIIDDGTIVVRPCTKRELLGLKKRLNVEQATLFLIIQNSELENLGYITISKVSKNDLLFGQFDCDQENCSIIKINTDVVDFFRKNLIVEKIITRGDFKLLPESYVIKELGSSKQAVPVWKESNGLILTAGPSVTPLEVCYASDAARNGWNSEWKKYLTAFETEFAIIS